MQDFLQRLQRLQARYEPEKAQPQSNIQPEQTGPVQLQTVNYPGQQTLPAPDPAQNQFMQRMAALENKYEARQTVPTPVAGEPLLPGTTQEPGQPPAEPEFYGPPQDVNRGAEAGIAAALEYLTPGAFTGGELNKDLSLGQKAKLSLARSSANVILEPAAMLLSLAGKDKEADVARRMLKAAGKKTALPEFEKEFDMSDLVDPDFWATKGTSLVPPLLALIPVSMAGASAGVGTGAALGLGRLGQTILGAVGGSLLGTPAEALMEAAQKYEQIYEETGDKQKAANAAADVAKANMLLLSGSNAFETALALTGGKKFKIAKKVLAGIKKAPKPVKKAILSYVPGAAAFITAGLSEGAEESFQGEFQRVYGGEENENGFNIKVFTERMRNMTPEEREQFVLGAIMGVIFQGAGTLTRDEIRRANKILSDEKAGADLKQKAQSDLIAIAAKEAKEKGISVEDLLWSAVVGKKQLAKAGEVAKDIERLKGGEKYRGSAPAQEQRPVEDPAASQIADAELDANLQRQSEEKAPQQPDEAQALVDDILAEDASQQVEAEPGEQPVLDTPQIEEQQAPEVIQPEETTTAPAEQGKPDVESNIDEDNTLEPVKKEIVKQDKKVASSKVYDVNVADIDTDTDRFQNRAAEFSEKTAATIAERYDENLFDPIVLWKDPADGKNYVLSGHSRLEGMKRRNAKNIPARFFQGSEEDAVKFAKLEANRLGAAENLAETINAYREAKAQKLSKKRMVDLFDGDTNWLDAAVNINPKGDFVRVLSQSGEVASEFPYIKRFSRWIGDLRGKYKDKLTNRHEQQLFDFLYKGDKKNRDIQKDDFYNLVESQINRTDFKSEQPLVLKRSERVRTGTKARKDTAQLEEQLDQLRSDLARARTDAERDAIQNEITRVSDAVKKIVRSQGDLFAQEEENAKRAERPAGKKSIKIKTEKTPAGEQTSFKPKPEVPKGKIKPKKEQKQVEGAGGVGLFKKDSGKKKEQSLFADDEGLAVESFERGGKKYERVKFRDATKAEIGSQKRRQKIVADMPERAGWEKTYLTKEKAFYYVRKAPDELVREEGADYDSGGPDKIFYSKLEKTLRDKLPGKGTPESMLQAIRGFMKKGDFKKDEYEWLGLEEWLQDQKGKVTKDDILEFVRANNVRLKPVLGREVEIEGDYTRVDIEDVDEFKRYLDDNVVELLDQHYDTLQDYELADYEAPSQKNSIKSRLEDIEKELEDNGVYVRYVDYQYDVNDVYYDLEDAIDENLLTETIDEFKNFQLPGGGNYREAFITVPNVEAKWRDGHDAYDNVKNPVVRIRSNERESIDGDKVFFIEELQEPQKHQLAKAPAWVKKYGNEIGMKYAIRYAAENGFDRVAWTAGEQQAERYNLSRQVDAIQINKSGDTYSIIARKNGTEVIAKHGQSLADVENLIGKDLAKKVEQQEDGKKLYSGLDLKVGGEGLKTLYDRMLPQFVKKYTKKWGAKVEPIQISTKPTEQVYNTDVEYVERPGGDSGFILSRINVDKGDYEYWDGNNWVTRKTDAKVFDSEKEARKELDALNKGYVTVHSVNITPKMRESVLKGQPLFERKKGYETRKGEESQEKIGRKEIKRLEVGYNRGQRGVLLANGIAEDFKRSGATELVGKTVNTPDELAVMAQVYRNPSFETLRYFFVKGNKIVHAIGVSSRLPGATAGYPDGLYGDDGIRWLKQQIKKAGADKFYILHNHPSGHVRPSKNDMSFTQRIQRNVKEYSGHVVINHGKYAVIDKSAKGFSEKEIAEVVKRDDPLTKPSKPHVLIGEQVSSSSDLAEIGFSLNVQKGWHVLIGRSADGRVRGLMEIPETLLKNKLKFMAQVRSFARKTGSMQAALVVDKLDLDAKSSSLLADYIRTGLLLDVVDYSGFGMLGSVVDGMPVVQDKSYDMGRRFDENKGKIVREPRVDITKTPAFKKWFGDSKVVDENGRPLVVYAGFSNVELYGDQYNPKRSTAGGFYATESPDIASNYAQSKFGVKEFYDDGEQYLFKFKNGKWGKKISSIKLTKEQQEKARRFLDNIGYDVESYWQESASYDLDSKTALLRGGLSDLHSIWKFMENMGETVVDVKGDTEKELLISAMRPNKFEELMNEIGIEWQSFEKIQPGVFPIYLSIQNPIYVEKEFPVNVLDELKRAAKGTKKISDLDITNLIWTKNYPLRNWIEDIENGDEFWTTHIPQKAIPILLENGYDGIKEVGLKGETDRSKRQINWIAFKPTQIKSAIGNRGTFDPNDPSILRERQTKYGYNDPIAYAGKLLYDNGMRDKANWMKAMVKKFGESNLRKIESVWPGADAQKNAGDAVVPPERLTKEKPPVKATKRKPASSKVQRATFIERPKGGLQASYFGTKAYTKEGAKLIHRIKKDKTGKKYNIRSVVDYLNNALGVEMRVGNEQLQGKTVAAYYSDPLHLYRTRAGDGIWNFHELGHAAANILAKSNKAYGRFLNQHKAELIALTEADDSFASAATPHEGFAELFMNIIVTPEKSKSKLSVALERLLKTETPELYKSVLDARAAFNEHMKRPITVRWHSKLAPIKPEPLHKRAQQLYHWFMYKAFSAEFAPIQRIESPIYAKIAKISRKTANIVQKQAIAPVKSSGHMLWHIPTEVARAVYGGGKSRQGVRIYIDPKDFSQMSSDELALFEEYGIKLPKNAKNGDVLYLTDFTWGDIIKAVGKEKWNAFEEYAQAKAAIDRLEKKNLVYPGMADDAPPDALREMIAEAEQENPDWPEQFQRANEFMNRLLLINILSGEIQASEYKRIVDAYDYYVPLPRDVERGIKRMGQSGGKLWSGLARAKGSPARFTPLSEAVEQRVRLTMSSYFHNRLRSQIVRMAEDLAAMDGIPDEAKRAAARVMVPLKLDMKKVATLSSDEMKKVVADYLNEIQKKEFGEDAELIKPSNINLSLPGRPIYRAVDPNAVNVVTRWEPGKGLLFYQVEDPIMYDFMTRTKDVPKALRFFTEMARDVLRPWKQSITHSPTFVAFSVIREVFSSLILGDPKGKERFILGGSMAVGLVNRMMGKKGIQEARADAELLSMSLDHTISSDHRLVSNAFMDVLKEGIWTPGYRRMSLSDKIRIFPGQVAFLIAKTSEMINWITGFRRLAQSVETVGREGAFVLAKKRGASDEQARYEFDMISGNFISQPGSAVLASIYRAGGFFNPAIQVIGQTIDRGTNPRTRSEFWIVTLPYVALLSGIMAATAYLLMDEEEREDWRELDDETRLRYFPIKVPGLPVMRAPFDYGPVGAVSSFGFNKVMGALIESPMDNSKMASAMLKRATDMPGLLDIMLTPHGKTFLELETDYSLFYGRSIRPAWMKTYYQDTPELQAYTSTPEIYRRIGKQIEKSPIMVEYAMRNLLGTSGSELIRITEQIERMGLKKAFTESPAYEKPFIGRMFWRPTVGYSSRSVKELGDAAKKFEIAKIRLKKLKDANPDSKKVQKLVQQYKAHEKAASYFKRVRAIGKEINKLRKDKTRSRDKEIDQLAKRMREYAKEALSAIEKARE